MDEVHFAVRIIACVYVTCTSLIAINKMSKSTNVLVRAAYTIFAAGAASEIVWITLRLLANPSFNTMESFVKDAAGTLFIIGAAVLMYADRNRRQRCTYHPDPEKPNETKANEGRLLG